MILNSLFVRTLGLKNHRIIDYYKYLLFSFIIGDRLVIIWWKKFGIMVEK